MKLLHMTEILMFFIQIYYDYVGIVYAAAAHTHTFFKILENIIFFLYSYMKRKFKILPEL